MSAVTPTMSERLRASCLRACPKGVTSCGPATSATSPIPPVRFLTSTTALELLHQMCPLVVTDADEVRALPLLQRGNSGAGRGPQHESPWTAHGPERVERVDDLLHRVAVDLE